MSLSKDISDQLEARAHVLSERKRIIERVLNAGWRAGATGFAIRGGLNLVTAVLGATVKRRAGVKPARSAADALSDTVRYAVFFSSLASTYVVLEEGIASVFGKQRSCHWRALVAGALAGPAIMLTGPGTRHTSLSIYILLRGLTLLARCGNRPVNPGWLRALLAPTRMQHGDTLIMCLSTVQLAYSWIFLQQTLPTPYVRFLNKHGGKDLAQYAAVKEVCMRNAAGAAAGTLTALQGTPYARLATSLPCDFLHAGQRCGQHARTFLPQAYMRALPVYVPVYIIPALLVHRKSLLQPPRCWDIWRKIGVGLLRSSAFLALYCTLAWRGACAGFQWSGRPTALVMCATCWVAGLATLIEKKSRRMELALYCLSRSLESFALSAVEWGWVNTAAVPRRLDVLLFSAGVAAIMHTYSDGNGSRRECFRSKYLNVLDFVFGNSGLDQGQITHNPSTNQLLTRIVSSPSLQRISSLAHILSRAGRQHSSESSSIGVASPRSGADSPDRAQGLADGSPPEERAAPLRRTSATEASFAAWRRPPSPSPGA